MAFISTGDNSQEYRVQEVKDMTSQNNTVVLGTGASVTGVDGSVYAIDGNGQITIDGVVDDTTANVDALGFGGGMVWQKNADNSWYSKVSASDTWVNYYEVNGVPPVSAQRASDSGTTYVPGSGLPLYDADGNSWAISGGQVVLDGSVDPTTANVTRLAYVNGVIWQENTDGNWYSKVLPSDTWTQAVQTDPIVAAAAQTLTWTGATSDPTDPAAWALPDGSAQAPMPFEALVMNGGSMDLGGGNLAGDVLSGANETVNLTDGGSVQLFTDAATVNVTGGTAALNVTSPPEAPDDPGIVTVTADTISSVILHADMTFGRLTETGGSVVVNGASHISGAYVLLNSDLSGSGTLDVDYNRAQLSVVEVNGAIGSGVTLSTESPNSALVLDNPGADQGTVALHYGWLEIKGEAATDSVSYQNSLVSLYQGNNVLAAVNVVGVAGQTGFGPNDGTLHFGKSDTGSVYVYQTNPPDGPSLTPLPQHGGQQVSLVASLYGLGCFQGDAAGVFR